MEHGHKTASAGRRIYNIAAKAGRHQARRHNIKRTIAIYYGIFRMFPFFKETFPNYFLEKRKPLPAWKWALGRVSG